MLARAIREGVGHDGRALIERLMPYQSFRYISDEGVASIVVFIRSIPPVHQLLPKTKVPMPFSVALKGFPKPLLNPVQAPISAEPGTPVHLHARQQHQHQHLSATIG